MVELLAGIIVFWIILGSIAAGLADVFASDWSTEPWPPTRPTDPQLMPWKPNEAKYHLVVKDTHQD